MEEFQKYLNEELIKKINSNLANLVNYGEEKTPLYFVDDIMKILNIKSTRYKINLLIDNKDKFTKSITIDNIVKTRTVITKNGVSKIIHSTRKPPHDIICKFFESSDNIFEVDSNNIYIKRLKHISAIHTITILHKIYIGEQTLILDVVFPKYGIIILFNKTENLFNEDNTIFAQAQNMIFNSKLVDDSNKSIKWIQFKSYDTNKMYQFDELLKDIISYICVMK